MKWKLQSTTVILTNIVVTFVQAAFAVWAANGFKVDKLAIGAVVGAGASAVWNLIVKPWLKSIGWLRTDA